MNKDLYDRVIMQLDRYRQRAAGPLGLNPEQMRESLLLLELVLEYGQADRDNLSLRAVVGSMLEAMRTAVGPCERCGLPGVAERFRNDIAAAEKVLSRMEGARTDATQAQATTPAAASRPAAAAPPER